MNLEESARAFADTLCDTLTNTGITSNLDDPEEAFQSGTYFGSVQGYKRGVNVAVAEVIECLPAIYNKIVESNFNMSIDWKEEYRKLVLKEVFGIETK